MQKSFGQTALSVNRVFRWGRLLYYCLLIFGEKICLCFSLFFVYGRFSNAGRFITDEFKEYLLRLRSTSRIGHPCFPVLSSLAIFSAKVADVFNLYISLYRINGYKICSERHPWCKKDIQTRDNVSVQWILVYAEAVTVPQYIMCVLFFLVHFNRR